MTECRSCEQEFDANGWCWRCGQFDYEQPPEKTMDQFNAEHPDILAEIRAELRESLIEFQLRKRPDGRYEVAA